MCENLLPFREPRRAAPASGFTLIEMSIVLVIIGLIVGGVLVGRSLIKSSELQSIIADKRMLITAIYTFQTKYNELPGDMIDATNYWGTDPATCPNNGTWGTMPLVATCNGDGNGFIQNTGSDYGTNPMFEAYRMWQHLANAKMIPGAYSGTPGPVSWTDLRPGINIPATKIPSTGFEWYSFNASTSYNGWFFSPPYNKPYLLFGKVSNTGELFAPILSGPDALSIDSKTDDGKPATGTVLATLNFVAQCTTTAVATTALYDTTQGSPVCILLFQAF